MDLKLFGTQNFCLTGRVTTTELLDKYGSKLKAAQETYKKLVNEAEQFLSNNYSMCKQIDEELGAYSDIEEVEEEPYTEVIDSKIRYKCPIHKCHVKTFRLRRHLNRHNLTPEQIEYGIKCSKLFATNSNVNVKSSTNMAQPCNSNTYLVNKKNNYKVCPSCEKLYLNLCDHLQNFHKLNRNDPEYKKFVNTCEVVPRVYTKMKAGMAIKLTGKDLNEAKEKHEENIKTQEARLYELKRLKTELETPIEQRDNEIDQEDIDELYKKYKEERYKDGRVISPKIASWKTTFQSFLSLRGDSNPKRGVAMAMEVLLCNGKALNNFTLDDLLNLKTLRTTLNDFKCNNSTNSTSKIKYLTYFEQLIKFLTTDISSPEHKEEESNESLIAKDIKIKSINHEISTTINNLSKNRGIDIIKAKEKATKKLINEDDANEVLKETDDFLAEMISIDENQWITFSLEKIRNIRDSLIVAATIRLARRSKELMTMSLQEYENAEDCTVNNETFKLIKVALQKDARSGRPAPIAFSQQEFKALTLFIKYLRPKMGPTKANNDFLSCNSKMSTATPLNYSAIYKILNKFRTKSGKALSSRALRGSEVTNSRQKNLTEKEKQDLATSMSHSVATAERSYNFSTVNNAVKNVLSKKFTEMHQLNTGNQTSKFLPCYTIFIYIPSIIPETIISVIHI